MKRLASSGGGTASSKNDVMVAWPSSSGLQKLPYEMMANVATSLSLEDVFDLSLCCRHFQYLITEDSFAKRIIRVSYSQLVAATSRQLTYFLSRPRHNSHLRRSKQKLTVAMPERCGDWSKDEEPSQKPAPMLWQWSGLPTLMCFQMESCVTYTRTYTRTWHNNGLESWTYTIHPARKQ